MDEHKVRLFLYSAGLMVATTVGAGIFSLPYVFMKSGWLTGIFYLSAMGGVIVLAHNLYWDILEKVQEKKGILGLVKEHLNKKISRFGFLIVIGGLVFALVAYLILSRIFVELLFPGLGVWGMIVFWILASIPMLLKLSRLVFLEIVGSLLMLVIIILIFVTTGNINNLFMNAPAVDLGNIFLPFGAIIFSLAGWTAIEPIFEFQRSRGNSLRLARRGMAWGVLVSALLYLLFILGIFGSTAYIAEDAISGLSALPDWKFISLIIFGLFAIYTSYVPISLEIKNSLEKDLEWTHVKSVGFTFFLPPILIFLGFSNFIKVIGVAGGVFLGLQYLLIILVARKILDLKGSKKILVDLLAAMFILAAVYEVYYFVIN